MNDVLQYRFPGTEEGVPADAGTDARGWPATRSATS